MRNALRKGFTLIELLLVVIIIGIVASIALPRFASVKESAYVAVLNSDLKTLNTSEEIRFNSGSTYDTFDMTATTPTAPPSTLNYAPSPDVKIKVVPGGAGSGSNYIGYYASAQHVKLPASQTKNRCVNIGTEATTLPTGFSAAGTTVGTVVVQPGVQYGCF